MESIDHFQNSRRDQVEIRDGRWRGPFQDLIRKDPPDIDPNLG